jgi:hypothetical protein
MNTDWKNENKNENEKSYDEIIEDLNASEKLEWESKKCFMVLQNKKSTLNYVLVAIVIFGLLTSSLWIGAFSSVQFTVPKILETFFLLPLIAIFTGLGMIFKIEQVQLQIIKDDANFRLNLALDIIRPLRDFLYSQAESSKLTAAQIATIKLRLARFPMDHKNRR